MEKLTASPPPESFWEGGGNSNFAIAAARLGLRCTCLGHVGQEDPFGQFLVRILREEGVVFQEVFPEELLRGQVEHRLGDGAAAPVSGENSTLAALLAPSQVSATVISGNERGGVEAQRASRVSPTATAAAQPVSSATVGQQSASSGREHQGVVGGEEYGGETLLCWVMVDPKRQHGFCSRFDFNKSPAFSSLSSLPPSSVALLQNSKALFLNGFAFDEFAPHVIQSAVQIAKAADVAVFFDPGPRTWHLSGQTGFSGQKEQRETFSWLLRASDVLLLTEEEASVLTQQSDPVLSAQMLLEQQQEETGEGEVEEGKEQGRRREKWVAVKRGPAGCVLATSSGNGGGQGGAGGGGLYSLPGFRVDVSDTVGCGDSFAAGIALGYLRQSDHSDGTALSSPVSPSTCLALANAVGAATAMGSGAGRNVARAARVAEILLGLQGQQQPPEEEKQEGPSTNGSGGIVQTQREDWDADIWLEDKDRQWRVAHVAVHGDATCPSGKPLLDSVREAADLLHHSLTKGAKTRLL